ncbi:retrovirus-related pol polyprotein from transposon TNT 1-94 [Tanacetum coccineum]|uniref:Retrovirus-related pol polyprotein from transposon TNT 1-94 n=1 Tax=Tanacetum coccineum TaxID=301880 RepID=A0ABQ4ZFX2_9ASTR
MADDVTTACYNQNRSLIHKRFNKTPYELINNRKPDISYLHVFGALYYLKNNHEDIGKLGAKGDIGFFIGYSSTSCAYRVSNRRTKKVIGNGYLRKGQEESKNDQTKHGMEKTKSNQGQSQSKSKDSQVEEIQLEGLKLPNIKLYHKG